MTAVLAETSHEEEMAKAREALAHLVENGDLERIVHLARLAGAAQDSLSDEIVTRLAGMASNAMCLLDRATRTGVMERMVAVAEKMDQEHILTDFLRCLAGATEEAAHAPLPKGGLTGLWELIKQPETQQTIQFLMLLGKHFRSCRLKH